MQDGNQIAEEIGRRLGISGRQKENRDIGAFTDLN